MVTGRKEKGSVLTFCTSTRAKLASYSLTVIRYQIRAANAQLKFARSPHLLTASLAATPVRLGPFYVAHPIRSVR
jgi:hypothetical protein